MGRLLIILTVLTVGFLSSCTSVGTSEVSASTTGYFPGVGGLNLLGENKTFPQCLDKEKTIAIVAFERWQQEWVDEWYAVIEQEQKSNSQLAYYEVPTIAKLSAPVRWWIYNGMRGGITDEYMRSRVITLHIDKEKFKQQLSITDEKLVYVYVLTPNGRIIAQSEGRFSAEKWFELLQKIK